jgi:hypothetical protein
LRSAFKIPKRMFYFSSLTLPKIRIEKYWLLTRNFLELNNLKTKTKTFSLLAIWVSTNLKASRPQLSFPLYFTSRDSYLLQVK